jgi:hypothetical protein
MELNPNLIKVLFNSIKKFCAKFNKEVVWRREMRGYEVPLMWW